eukprot:8266984-Ditylum_brightwellii.AAC.1
MYPSVRLKLTRKALTHYSRNLSEDNKATIRKCVGLIKFGMCNTLAIIDGNGALAIDAYEAAIYADVVASYVFEMAE